jgi:transposase
MQPRRGYRSDLSDKRWALIEPVLAAWRAGRGGLGIKQPTHDLREIVNAILYVVRTGIAWEYLPHDFPPYKTVYDYYSQWEADGTAEKIHDLLRVQVRRKAGRAAEPTAGVIDAQAVKTADTVPEAEQGIDAGKKIKGRKRHIAVDVLGLLLVVVVTAASVQDTNGGKLVVDGLAAACPLLTLVWVDSGYKARFVEHAANAGITAEVVAKEPGQKGFKALPRRWVVERTLGWLMRYRRLARDYETNPRRSRTMIHWAMIDIMGRRLTSENTQTWGHDLSEPSQA